MPDHEPPLKVPKGYEGGSPSYKVTAETFYYEKPKALPKATKAPRTTKLGKADEYVQKVEMPDKSLKRLAQQMRSYAPKARR